LWSRRHSQLGEMPAMADDADLPYSERPEWQDVEPIAQDDGPHPLAVIRYPPGFQEVHSYFRAVQQRNEFSDRALKLTADVIEHNSANYTAWYYRRRCLKELKSDLQKELEFADKWARDCPKNYQVWYHRRWIITEMADAIRSSSKEQDDIDKEVKELGQRELEYHTDVMQVNDDYKNYNGWSHRQFIVSKFGLWDKEMMFVEDLLRDDIRNNSAWNHRYTVVKNTNWPLTQEAREREVEYTAAQIRKCANNESAWNYLAAFFGDGQCKVPWDSVPAVETLIDDVLAQASCPEQQCRYAVEARANLQEVRGQVKEALSQYELLKKTDKIRVNYWDWRIALLQSRAGKQTGVACQE